MTYLKIFLSTILIAACAEDKKVEKERHEKSVKYVIERMHAGELDTSGAVVVEADRPKIKYSSGNEIEDQVIEKPEPNDRLTTIEALIVDKAVVEK